jgi:predicted ABC-type ATPase
VLRELEQLAAARADFAFESTLSGRSYVERLQRWKRAGYRIEIVFLQLKSPKLALKRIAARVSQGGHDVPKADVLRRLVRGRENFEKLYKPLADSWALYDNSTSAPVLLEQSA